MTSSLLILLNSCAQRTSMFDDPAGEVDELTGLIKQDIQVRLWGGKGGVVKCLGGRGRSNEGFAWRPACPAYSRPHCVNAQGLNASIAELQRVSVKQQQQQAGGGGKQSNDHTHTVVDRQASMSHPLFCSPSAVHFPGSLL